MNYSYLTLADYRRFAIKAKSAEASFRRIAIVVEVFEEVHGITTAVAIVRPWTTEFVDKIDVAVPVKSLSRKPEEFAANRSTSRPVVLSRLRRHAGRRLATTGSARAYGILPVETAHCYGKRIADSTPSACG